MNRYLVIGGGLQGEAIAYDILKYDRDSIVRVVDYDASRLKGLQSRINSPRLETIYGDARNFLDMSVWMESADVAISAASYELNEDLTKMAIATKTHFCDLGGNNTVVGKQFSLDKEARESGLMIVPDCGIAPGAVSIMAAKGIDLVENPEYVRIYVGGLPQNPRGDLKYMKVFSIRGLVNEYIEPVEVLQDYKIKTVSSLGGIEQLLFEDERLMHKCVALEAAYTSGGSSTLAKTYQGKIRELFYKTLRYPEHWVKVSKMRDEGKFREDIMIDGITQREFTEKALEKEITYEDKDIMFVQVLVGNNKEKLQLQMVDFHDDITGHSAMQRTTGYSAAIIAQMMTHNYIFDKGVLNIEKSVSPDVFFPEWRVRNLDVKVRIKEWRG